MEGKITLTFSNLINKIKLKTENLSIYLIINLSSEIVIKFYKIESNKILRIMT